VRTQPALYALFGGLFGAPFLLCTFITLAWEPTFWVPSAFVGISLAIILAWLATTRLTLTSDAIRYRSLFSRTDVPLASILKVRFEQGFVPFSYKPYLRVIITVRGGARKKDVTLNAGLFHQARVRRWIETVNARLSSGRSTLATIQRGSGAYYRPEEASMGLHGTIQPRPRVGKRLVSHLVF